MCCQRIGTTFLDRACRSLIRWYIHLQAKRRRTGAADAARSQEVRIQVHTDHDRIQFELPKHVDIAGYFGETLLRLDTGMVDMFTWLTEQPFATASWRHRVVGDACTGGQRSLAAGIATLMARGYLPDARRSVPRRHAPPYGMIGRVEETSASFEARSAPQLYPTVGARDNSRPYRETASCCAAYVAYCEGFRMPAP